MFVVPNVNHQDKSCIICTTYIRLITTTDDVWDSKGTSIHLALNGGDQSVSSPDYFVQAERGPSAKWTRDCVEPRAGLDTVG